MTTEVRTLLIVDDEAIIRRGIHFHIDWAANGIEVVGEAANGEDGLQKAIKYHPDIIISDIRMPIMNGIVMAEKIRKLLPNTRIIFISGYDDKEYLLGAIKNGAADFVMKSANSGDILQATLRCKERLDAENQEDPTGNASAIMEYCFQNIRLNFMDDIISGKMTQELLLDQAGLLEINLTGPYYFPFLLNAPSDSDVDGMIMSLLFSFNVNSPFLVFKKDAGIIGILNLSSCEIPLEQCQSIMKQFHRTLAGIQMLIPQSAVDAKDISYILGRLLAEKDHLCWHMDEQLVYLNEYPPEQVDLNLLFLLEQEILRAFSHKNYMDVLGKLEQFFSFFQNHHVPLQQYQESMKRIVISVFTISGKYEQAPTYLKTIEERTDTSSIFQTMNDIIREFAPQIPHNTIVKMAIEYIENHYSEQISLNEIARHCCVTPSYISKIFKNDVNIGIVHYIHNIRINKAKELILHSDLKTAEIARAVGYLEYKRFSSYFLKITGMSPREYKSSKERSDT